MELNLILASGVLALLYGLWTIRSVLSLPAGNARMQEIAAAMKIFVMCVELASIERALAQ